MASTDPGTGMAMRHGHASWCAVTSLGMLFAPGVTPLTSSGQMHVDPSPLEKDLCMICQPLHGLRVLDFSTLLPGPMCSSWLADAGADIVKVERPGTGDEMRGYVPKLGAD